MPAKYYLNTSVYLSLKNKDIRAKWIKMDQLSIVPNRHHYLRFHLRTKRKNIFRMVAMLFITFLDGNLNNNLNSDDPWSDMNDSNIINDDLTGRCYWLFPDRDDLLFGAAVMKPQLWWLAFSHWHDDNILTTGILNPTFTAVSNYFRY